MFKKDEGMRKLDSMKIGLFFTITVALTIVCSTFALAGEQHNQVDFQKNGSEENKYTLEVAYQINQNWEFIGAGAVSPDLQTSIIFKVLPDGEITDIIYFEKSGNEKLDRSAYHAITRSSPVKPFPDTISRKYIQMGLNFTPKRNQ